MIRFLLVACVLFFASVAYSNPVQVGPTQVWVDTPDYAALEATGTQEDILEAFRDSLHSVNVNAQNPNGLTLNGAIAVLNDFEVNIDDLMLPCDHVIDAIEENLADASMPAAVLRAVVKDGTDCVDYGNVIIGVIDVIGEDPVRKECIKYDAFGNCIEYIQNYPCDVGQSCECVLEDDEGKCVFWSNIGPFGPIGGPGETPGFDIGGGEDIGGPGTPGTGEGPGGEGPGPGGGGGVVEFCKEYLPEISASAFDDPRLTIVIADGADYMREGSEQFDVIIVDSTDPLGPGEVLFTDTFYGHCEASACKERDPSKPRMGFRSAG